jgi:hypothetical protein
LGGFRGFDDKGMGPKIRNFISGGSDGFRGFEHLHVNAAVPEKAVFAVVSFQGANHLFQGMAENTAKGGAFVMGKLGLIFKRAGKLVFAEEHRDLHRNSLSISIQIQRQYRMVTVTVKGLQCCGKFYISRIDTDEQQYLKKHLQSTPEFMDPMKGAGQNLTLGK